MKDREGRWIRFHLTERKPRSEVFDVITKNDNTSLGEIKWFGRWRRYAFFPLKDTVFDLTCLDDITNFISGLMRQRYESKKSKIVSGVKAKEKRNAEHFIESPKQLQLDIGKILQLKKIISVNDQKLDYYARK